MGFFCYNKEYRQVINSYTYIGALSWLRAFPSKIKQRRKVYEGGYQDSRKSFSFDSN